MGQIEKLLLAVLGGHQDCNIKFNDLRRLLDVLGFTERVRGDHHIYTRDGVQEIINLQPNGGYAKPYQVKQVRNLIIKYKLGGNYNV